MTRPPPQASLPDPEQPAVASAAEPSSRREPTVSIVITCYNQGRYLSEAIESAQAQTHAADEIVVVDDGSTDDTPQVIARSPGVRAVRQANRGLAAARNLGLRQSTGEFVIFLDADDTLEAVAVEAGLRAFASEPSSAFVFGRFLWSNETGRWQDAVSALPWPRDAYPGLLNRNFIGMHAAVMYRRDALKRAGGYDESLPACEDYDVYLRIARASPVSGHETIVAVYRQHADNLSRDAALMLRSVLRVLRRQRPYAASDDNARSCLRAGLEAWKRYYGKPLVEQAVTHLREPGKRLRGAAEVLTVLRHARGNLFSEQFNALRVLARACMPAVPARLRNRILRRWPAIDYKPRPGRLRLGDLDRLSPVSRAFGFDRGRPIDRYYIEAFLAAHSHGIRGRVLEIGDREYTRRFGGARVVHSDVLNLLPGNAQTTIQADLIHGTGLPSGAFDCIIATQTLHLIFDVPAALRTLHRALRPEGTLLLTVPGTISQLAADRWRDYWHWGFTASTLARLLAEAFPDSQAAIVQFGNVLVCTAFLQGMAAEELSATDLDHCDELYPLVLAARVRRSRPDALQTSASSRGPGTAWP
jgi:glycosyltransferase involved in cell wall biosynthesis